MPNSSIKDFFHWKNSWVVIPSLATPWLVLLFFTPLFHDQFIEELLLLFVLFSWSSSCFLTALSSKRTSQKIIKIIIFFTVTTILFFSLLSLNILYQNKKERDDTYDNLSAQMDVPLTGNLLDSVVKYRNGGQSAIGSLQIIYKINYLNINKVFIVNDGTGIIEASSYLLPGGVGDNSVDLKKFFALSPKQPTSNSCGDLTLAFKFFLLDQPKTEIERSFRFNTRPDGDTYKWYEKSLGNPQRDCP